MKTLSALTLLLALTAGPAAAQVTIPTPDVADNKTMTVVSLSRARPDWRVVTSIELVVTAVAAQPDLLFTVGPVAHGTLTCPLDANGAIVAAPGSRSVRCSYEPALKWSGPDSFVWRANYRGGASSEPVTVAIDVRERGLRWEFKASGSTITSDRATDAQLASIPDIVGGTSQDFLFTLNWQTVSPRQHLQQALSSTEQTQSAALAAARVAGAFGRVSRSQNLLIETGVESDTVESTVVDIGTPATPATPATTAPAGAPAEKPVARRNLVMRTEWNVNAALDADGQGTFIEVGGIARGAFSTVLNSDESFVQAAGRVLQVIPKDRTGFRFDYGGRIAVKQSHESTGTSVITGPDQVERASNIEDLALFEFGRRFDSAMGDAPTGDLDPRWAWMLRASVFPHVKLAGHQLGLIGVEATKPEGGTFGVKVLYGVNLSASRGIFAKDGE